MHDWNVVATIHEGHFHQAIQFLETFGQLSKTDYFNVLVRITSLTLKQLASVPTSRYGRANSDCIIRS